jgi:hypothetical protein
MRLRRTHRIGPAEADRLAAGDHPGPTHAPLTKLLDAARAPATADELSGEKAAVAAFTEHRRRAARAARHPARTRTAVATIAAGLALLSATGTAVAARTGNLPQEAQQHAHRLFSALGIPAPRTGTPSPAPTVVVLSWCDARRGPTPLNSENRRKLADAAGGENAIDRYCADLRRAASATPGGPARKPTPPAGPTSGAPSRDRPAPAHPTTPGGASTPSEPAPPTTMPTPTTSPAVASPTAISPAVVAPPATAPKGPQPAGPPA